MYHTYVLSTKLIKKIIPNKFALHSKYNMKFQRNTFRTNIMMKKNSYNSKPLDITTPIMLVLLVSVNCLEKLLKITLNSHNS